jgi:hypothetical protein
MNFDFYNEYKQYSSVELLKIVKKAADDQQGRQNYNSQQWFNNAY